MSKEILRRLEALENKGKKQERVGEFYKVSFDQFLQDSNSLDVESLKKTYDNIKEPERQSEDSAGHDFVLTKDINLKPGESAHILTGIRVKVEVGWVLLLAPRSGLGNKFRMELNNTVAVIDGDYFGSDNEGHIMATITNRGVDGKDLILSEGERFIQGLFVPYGITKNDDVEAKRNGGFNSSGTNSEEAKLAVEFKED